MRIGLFGQYVSTVDVNFYTEREWIRWFAYDLMIVLHILRQESKKHGREICAHYSVPDVSNVSLVGVMQRMKFIQNLSQVAAENFPELMAANYFVRAPWVFSKIFSFARPFLDKDTVSKFVMTTDVPLALFEQVVPRSLIPKEYGGDSDAVIGVPMFAKQQSS
jgi:CRAL/TRIO domain